MCIWKLSKPKKTANLISWSLATFPLKPITEISVFLRVKNLPKYSKEHPQLKVIIFSVEDRIQRVRTLLNKGIDAYVCKSRKGIQELKEAIHYVYQDQIYLSPQVSHAKGSGEIIEITDYDILLIKQLSYGLGQDEIRQYFIKNSIKPNSISSIEKSIGHLKVQFRANNVPHLIALTKDLGII